MTRSLLLLAVLLLAGCGETETSVFYTARYPVVKVEAEVTLQKTAEGGSDTGSDEGTATDDGSEGSGSISGSESGTTDVNDDTGGGSDGGSTEENPLVREIEEAIVAAAPVQAGGGYTLYFSQYNGGRARIVRTPEAEAVTGVFGKDPGKSEFEILFDEEDYVCTISSYNDGTNVRKTVLEVDLTEAYRALYPAADIERAVRREYTSATAN